MLLPLSRLVDLHVSAARHLATVQSTFLSRPAQVPPFVIALAGSVAVGKSTLARLLKGVFACWPEPSNAQLVTTDGLLYSNRVLEERGLLDWKGFPESYDQRRMIDVLRAVKAGEPKVSVPVYSHLAYDTVPGQFEMIRRPDILIFEGLNMLQVPTGATVTASDFFGLSVYLDAAEADIERWFLERLLAIQRTAFRNPDSYFHQFSHLEPETTAAMGRRVWAEINGPNLRENIAPTRARAQLVVTKGADHAVREVALRRG